MSMQIFCSFPSLYEVRCVHAVFFFIQMHLNHMHNLEAADELYNDGNHLLTNFCASVLVNRPKTTSPPKCLFGFHPMTKKCIVVRFFYRQMNHVTESYDLGCEVFTLGTWSWKSVGSIDCYLTGQGINANGYLYWTKGVNTVIPDQIVAFDLESEKFNSIAVPDFLSYQIIVQGAMFLVQLEGKLCVVNAPYDSPGSMDAWMLEDPINNVWIHRFSISLHSIPGYRRRPEPVFIHNGRVLLRWLEKLFYRSLDNEQEDTECVYTDNCLNSSAKAYAFVESLVSLDSENHHSFIS